MTSYLPASRRTTTYSTASSRCTTCSLHRLVCFCVPEVGREGRWAWQWRWFFCLPTPQHFGSMEQSACFQLCAVFSCVLDSCQSCPCCSFIAVRTHQSISSPLLPKTPPIHSHTHTLTNLHTHKQSGHGHCGPGVTPAVNSGPVTPHAVGVRLPADTERARRAGGGREVGLAEWLVCGLGVVHVVSCGGHLSLPAE